MEDNLGATVTGLFEEYRTNLEEEGECRDRVQAHTRELETAVRQMQAALHVIHAAEADITMVCGRVRSFLPTVANEVEAIMTLLGPDGESYRFRDMWAHSLTRLSFILAILHWLEYGALITKEEVVSALGMSASTESGVGRKHAFTVEIHDYLTGISMLPAELSRLCVNGATHGNYDLAIRISGFVNELHSGFQMLNLKSDNLRKKYDAIKYDLRRIEGVIYDLSVRGLIPPQHSNHRESLKTAS